MIAGNHQLEVRPVFEEILPHEPRGNAVAAGKRLDLGLSPSAPLLRLDRHHQACSAQPGHKGSSPALPSRFKANHFRALAHHHRADAARDAIGGGDKHGTEMVCAISGLAS